MLGVDVGYFHHVSDGVDYVFVDHPSFPRPGERLSWSSSWWACAYPMAVLMLLRHVNTSPFLQVQT